MDVRKKLVELLREAPYNIFGNKLGNCYFDSSLGLIDADALIKEALAEGAYGYVDAEQIADAPTIDAVPVVRCKDCKHHYWEQEPCHGKSVHYCELPHMRGIEVFKEFFCYYGERKENK